MAPALRVSILLPCLNARQFLEPRIDSLLAQTFCDWEAIVLDSHSTDGSWDFFDRSPPMTGVFGFIKSRAKEFMRL